MLRTLPHRLQLLSRVAVSALNSPTGGRARTPAVHFDSIHYSSKTHTMASKRLSGKTVLITGASSGIGRSTAFEFARTCPDNLRLILTARRIDTLHDIASEINQEVGHGVKVLSMKLDVSNAKEVYAFVQDLPEEWKDIHILVNNA